jgi:hypothetical protein
MKERGKTSKISKEKPNKMKEGLKRSKKGNKKYIKMK